METIIRIWVKDREPEQTTVQGVRKDVVHSQDVPSRDLYATMRELEKTYAQPRYAIRTRALNPLGL